MDSIFFEKQEGALCAQHALNALLQGPYFTAVDLAAMARTLDAEEREVLRQGDADSPEYLRAFQHDSFNMDDTGYFSVQVICAALRIWNLRLVPYTANDDPISVTARADPTSMMAYICNFREHWFAVRRFASGQWFNLNSLLNGPELISPTYLHMFLNQLQTEGYSIFVVDGTLPNCAADTDLLLSPSSAVTGGPAQRGDPELEAAIALSLGKPLSGPRAGTPDEETAAAMAASAQQLDEEDKCLKEAIAQSLASLDDEELKQAILLSMQNGNDSEPSTSAAGTSYSVNASVPTTSKAEAPDAAELRARRAAFLNRLQNSQQSPSENAGENSSN